MKSRAKNKESTVKIKFTYFTHTLGSNPKNCIRSLLLISKFIAQTVDFPAQLERNTQNVKMRIEPWRKK